MRTPQAKKGRADFNHLQDDVSLRPSLHQPPPAMVNSSLRYCLPTVDNSTCVFRGFLIADVGETMQWPVDIVWGFPAGTRELRS